MRGSFRAGSLVFFLSLCVFFATGAIGAQGAVDTQAEGEEEQLKNYVYDPTGKTDPFKPFIITEEEMAAKKKRKPRTYLETLDISQLDLIAIIVGPRGNFAMVRDAKGLGFVIRKGTPIGINGGVVKRITEKEVIIQEGHKEISKKLSSLR